MNHSGREDDYHLEGYKRIGRFVNENTPENAIFLAPETSFRYYADRDTVWINESIAHLVADTIYSSNAKYAAENLKKNLKVSQKI